MMKRRLELGVLIHTCVAAYGGHKIIMMAQNIGGLESREGFCLLMWGLLIVAAGQILLQTMLCQGVGLPELQRRCFAKWLALMLAIVLLTILLDRIFCDSGPMV